MRGRRGRLLFPWMWRIDRRGRAWRKRTPSLADLINPFYIKRTDLSLKPSPRRPAWQDAVDAHNAAVGGF